MQDGDAEVFHRVHAGDSEGEAYHGTALRPMLSEISAEVAAARPLPAGHTIWEIVLHLVAWHEWAVEKLNGKDPKVDGDGWVSVSDASAGAWRATRERLDRSHARLVARIRGLTSERPPRAEYVLRFILHHDIYHAGQIGLLRRASAPARRTGTP